MQLTTVYVPVSVDSPFKVTTPPDDEGNAMSCNVDRIEAHLLSKEDAERISNAIRGLMYEFKEQNFRIVENGISREYEACREALQILNKSK